MRRLALLVAWVLVLGTVASGALPSTPPAVAQETTGPPELCDTAAVEQFTDVADGDYASAYVLCMRALGLSVGSGAGAYGPDRQLNRGQMASFLVRLWRDVLGNQCPTGVVTPFVDVAADSTHAKNIECIYGLEITAGTGPDTYGPTDPLKATQISRFLYRVYTKAGGDMCPGTDGSELDRAAECLLQLRVVPSTGEATAATTVTRAQMAVYMVGLWHNLSGRGLPPPPPPLGTPTPVATTTNTIQPTQTAPTTQLIAYTHHRGSYPLQINEVWVMNADGTDHKQLTDNGFRPTWSPDGTRIVYEAKHGILAGPRSQPPQVWVMNADGTDQKQLTDDGGYVPAWSPDGTRIAYNSFGVWVMNADGTDQKQLTEGGFGHSPVWSPDGTRITYTAGRPTDTGDFISEFWVMNADGTNPTRVTDTVDIEAYAWSPDSTRIAYNYYTSADGLWVMNADGTDQKQLTDNGSAPVWSPDGTRIAYRAVADGNWGVWVMNADGTDQKQLTDNGSAPVWSPDGTRIAYNSGGVWVINADGTDQKHLEHATAGGSSRGPVWSPVVVPEG